MKQKLNAHLRELEKSVRMVQFVVFLFYLVFLVNSQAFAFNPGELGQNLSNVAKQILQPLGWVIAIVKGAQVFTDEHNRLRNALWAFAGILLGFWDQTISFIKGLVGG